MRENLIEQIGISDNVKFVRIGDITQTASGTTPSRSRKDYWEPPKHPWVKTAEIAFGSIYQTEERISEIALHDCSLPLLPPGTVLVAMYGQGKTRGQSAILEVEATINQACFAIYPNEVFDPKYLQLWLRHCYKHLRALSDGRGGNQANLNGAILNNFEIPLVSREKQLNIIKQLGAQLAAVEEAQQAAQEQIQEAKALTRRIREKSLEALEDVPRITLGKLLLGIEAGKSLLTSERIASETELGILKVSAVSWEEFRPTEAKAIEGQYTPEPQHLVKRGDLLISRANTVELVGAVVRVGRDYPYRLLSDKTLRLVIDEDRVCPDFLVQVLRMPEAREHIEGNATGTSDSMRNISQDTIRTIPVPVLSIAEQQKIAAHLAEIDATLRTLTEAAQAQLCEIELLPSRLLAQAFGEYEAA